jgi:RNA polymerase sigma-70 factor (ECF subfamily)
LLLRVKDPDDHDAWLQFAEIYQPIIYRMARRRGLQDADAQDLSQKVLASVSERIADWEHNPDRGRFSTWLTVVTRNAIIDSVRRLRPDTGEGGSAIIRQLQRLPASDQQTASEIQTEYRRQMFRRAACLVRREFEPSSWQAFWMTSIESVGVSEAAGRLGLTTGAVYAARSRIMRRLREVVSKWEAENDEA